MRGRAQVSIECGQWQSATLRQFEVGGIVQAESEAVGKVQRFVPRPIISERGPAEFRVDARSPNRNRETICDLESLEGRDDRAIVSDLLEERVQIIGRLIGINPG